MKHTLTLTDEQVRTIHAALSEYLQALRANCGTEAEIVEVKGLIADTDI